MEATPGPLACTIVPLYCGARRGDIDRGGDGDGAHTSDDESSDSDGAHASDDEDGDGDDWPHRRFFKTLVLPGASALSAPELGKRIVGELRGGCVCAEGAACTCVAQDEGTLGQEMCVNAMRGADGSLVFDACPAAGAECAGTPGDNIERCDLVVFYDTAAQLDKRVPVNWRFMRTLYAVRGPGANVKRLRGPLVVAAERLSPTLEPMGQFVPLTAAVAARVLRAAAVCAEAKREAKERKAAAKPTKKPEVALRVSSLCAVPSKPASSVAAQAASSDALPQWNAGKKNTLVKEIYAEGVAPDAVAAPAPPVVVVEIEDAPAPPAKRARRARVSEEEVLRAEAMRFIQRF